MNLKALTDRLGVLTDPRFWHRNYPIDDDWDRALAAAMFLVEHDARPLEILNAFEVRIAGLDVWVENWPYAFGYPATAPGGTRVLPRRNTALALRKLVVMTQVQEAAASCN